MIRKTFLFSLLVVILIRSSVSAYEFPPYAGIQFKLTGQVSEKYNNNITFAKDSENKQEQFTTMLSFGMDMRYEGKKSTVGLSGQMNQPVRYQSTDIRNSSELANLSLLYEITEYDRMNIYDTFTHTQVPGSFQESDIFEECRRIFEQYGSEVVNQDPRCAEFEEEFGRIQGKYDTYSNSVNIDYNRHINDQLAVNAGYRNFINESSRTGSRDSVQNSYIAGFIISPDIITSYRVSYSYSETDYDKGDNIAINSIRAGLRRYLTKRLIFKGDAGMNFSSSTDTVSINAVLSNEIDKKTYADISFNRDIRTASDREEIFRSWRVSGRFNRALTEKMKASLSGFYGKGKFVSEGDTDTLLGLSASIRHIFWQHKRGSRFSGTLGYTYSKLSSTNEDRGYDRNSINAGLTLSF